jgi:hypothetical protein
MRTTHHICLLATGPSGSGLADSFSSLEARTSRNEEPRDADTVGLDAYTIAVLISVGATILSLCV